MAVDEAILETTGQGQANPTLRFYAWEPACISLGYGQPLTDVNLPKLQSNGWDVVRRPTGGRAVLHVDELTYSISGSASDPLLSGGVLETYQRIARVLVHALNALGVLAEMEGNKVSRGGGNVNPVCFEVPSTYEITAKGKKIIGSAQARRGNGVLQHGSLPLKGDLTRILQILSYPTEEDRREAGRHLLDHATTLDSLVGRDISWDEVSERIAQSFREVHELELEPGDLTPEERERALYFMNAKYNSPEKYKR